ncbi:MAG: hypothetical protein UR83_C0057G0004 [Candidatus Moranbacteria bacterium GW2011_GWF2_35_54]|nr:MAG: hypothetical protein UR83_C0057G0004 [Candidatus Moranbacteria bacterium GW2011_GWF2_35_54]
MIEWQQEYFQKFSYARNQILKYLSSARKDLSIAKKAKIDEVRFQFAYNAFLKLGISLMACYGFKVRSRAGHHIKILEQTALILNDENITAYGNQMRKTRNGKRARRLGTWIVVGLLIRLMHF